MGIKIGREKCDKCKFCFFCDHPTLETNYADASADKFCFEKECKENIPQVMILRNKVISK